jgi:hypothetical protein
MWKSKTGQFMQGHMDMLSDLSADELAKLMVTLDPVVVLRALAEIMLNGNEGKLNALLRKRAVNARWERYQLDTEADGRDDRYAQLLRERRQRLQEQRSQK